MKTDAREVTFLGLLGAGIIFTAIILSGCAAAPVTVSPATSGDVAAVASDAAAVQAACAEAMPYAAAAAFIPIVGTYVAAGVQVGCSTADGIAKLIADPTSAAWLGAQLQLLKNALGKT